MDKQSLFVQVANLEERIGDLYVELGSLRHKIRDLIEENQELLRENERLRNAMNTPGQSLMDSGQENLRRIYDEGFHVCNFKYGSLRTEGECLFCMAFMQK